MQRGLGPSDKRSRPTERLAGEHGAITDSDGELPDQQQRPAAASSSEQRDSTHANQTQGSGSAGREQPSRRSCWSAFSWRRLPGCRGGGGGQTKLSKRGAGSEPDEDIESFIRSLKLEREIAALFPAGTTLEGVVKMEPAQTADVLRRAMPVIQQTFERAQAKARRVQEAEAAGGAKFSGVLKGGPYEAFLDGVTGIVGEPAADLERGMREEHTAMADSETRFSTGNYGLTTSPKREWELVESGGRGLARKVVKDSKEECVIVTGTRGALKGGQEGEDLRVLRPIEYYGNFDGDGRLIDPASNDADTPIQRTVKEAGLRRVEVNAVILYTGPLFTLYNSILRGFGNCGEVKAGVEFGSEEFWKQSKGVSIDEWVEKSGHRFTNTIHALASAIKKLQRLSEQGELLWRGLGGLDVAEFIAGCGFTDRAFMSTTKDRRTAMEYSGVKKGLVGTVLCIETSTTNNGAEIAAFSQYPREAETVWGACSFLQNFKSRSEMELPDEGGIVKIVYVLCSANSKALTVEELEGRRKKVVMQMLDTLHNDVCRFVETESATAEFQARVAQDSDPDWKDDFVLSIKDESSARVAMYNALPDSAYVAVEMLGEAVSQGLALPLLARAKLRLWLEDPSLDLYHSSQFRILNFNFAQGRRLARRRLLLQASAGGAETAVLALEDCQERRLVSGVDAAALERRDIFSGETPLITQIQFGDHENAQRLLQAGADANAVTAGTSFLPSCADAPDHFPFRILVGDA